MSDARRELLEEYSSAVRDSLNGGGEAALHRAYELGRKAMAKGLGVLDVAAVHQEALSSALSRRPLSAQARGRALGASGALFAECLSSFEMTQRGFQESLEAVKSTAARLLRVNAQLRQEIAERRQAERQSRSMAMALENAVEGISRVDSRGRFLSVNKAYAGLSGHAPEEMKGRDWRLAFHPDDRARVAAAQQRLLAKGKAETEVRGLRRDGSAFYCQVVLIKAAGKPKETAGHYCFLRDITERRLAEEERARRLAESARAEALARSNADLQQFARVVAHDLQEPLRTIISCTKLLAQRSEGGGGGQAKKCAARAGEGARRMSRLITDLLAYARVETQVLPFEPTDCAAALAGALANLKAAAQESRARVTHGPLPNVAADPAQLISLFQNLIGNAIRFRGAAAPRIHVSARRRADGWVFSVRDNGTGFQRRDADRLFTLFERLNPRIPGHGIGLAICKKIVERHGGKIWAASEPGRGATFQFLFPSAPANGGRPR